MGISSTNSAEASGIPACPRDCARSFHSGLSPRVAIRESTGVVGATGPCMPRPRSSVRTDA